MNLTQAWSLSLGSVGDETCSVKMAPSSGPEQTDVSLYSREREREVEEERTMEGLFPCLVCSHTSVFLFVLKYLFCVWPLICFPFSWLHMNLSQLSLSSTDKLSLLLLRAEAAASVLHRTQTGHAPSCAN